MWIEAHVLPKTINPLRAKSNKIMFFIFGFLYRRFSNTCKFTVRVNSQLNKALKWTKSLQELIAHFFLNKRGFHSFNLWHCRKCA